MSKVSKATKPKKMVKKIHNAFKREYLLYDKQQMKIRDELPVNQVEPLHRVTKNLWFKECGLTMEELHEVVLEEWANVRVLELLNAY